MRSRRPYFPHHTPIGEAAEVGYEAIIERAKRAREERLWKQRNGEVTGPSVIDKLDELGHDCPYSPSEEEIAQRAAAIRKGWSEQERAARLGMTSCEVMPPMLKHPDFKKRIT